MHQQHHPAFAGHGEPGTPATARDAIFRAGADGATPYPLLRPRRWHRMHAPDRGKPRCASLEGFGARICAQRTGSGWRARHAAPRSRRRPPSEPAGTFRLTLPPSVGTSILPPNTASHGGICRRTMTSRPSSSYSGGGGSRSPTEDRGHCRPALSGECLARRCRAEFTSRVRPLTSMRCRLPACTLRSCPDA